MNGANASQLDVSSPVQFEPESSTVRLNFYWSISLILSVRISDLESTRLHTDHLLVDHQISVAALAVTSRGYVAMLARSKHRAAHKKLGDLDRRWAQAERLLAPAVELLPQLLIIPVLLFVAGLLDNILSSVIPLSKVFLPIFIAALLSCVFALVVLTYTGWTVIHGCLYPETSPFQSTLSQLLAIHGTRLYKALTSAYVASLEYSHSWRSKLLTLTTGPHSQCDHSLSSVESGSSSMITSQGKIPAQASLATHEIHAYHSAIQQTHEDDIVDQAAAVLDSILWHPVGNKIVSSEEMSSLCYMLSDGVSIRTNLTTARCLLYLEQYAVLRQACLPLNAILLVLTLNLHI